MTGRYELRARIGAGAFGEVWRAFDRVRGHEVAWKETREGGIDADDFAALAAIDHAGLVRLLDDGAGFHTMEMIDGRDLLSHVRRPRTQAKTPRPTLPLAFGQHVQEGNVSAFSPCDVEELAIIRDAFGQLARAVGALHRAGFVHRDLVPANVLVEARGRVVVVDYGLVTRIGRAHAGAEDAAVYAGTPAYMAPEQASSREASVDTYAIGVMLFEALAGALPFAGSAQEVMTKKQSVSAPRPSFVVDLPKEARNLDALCERLLRREPSMRPSDEELAGAFR